MRLFILLSMIFLHIFDDYYHQGKSFLVEGKQKSWWDKNYPDTKYRHDYLIVLVLHALSWSFMVHIPLVVLSILKGCDLYTQLSISIIIHTIIHAIIDNLKANKFKINLIQDQLFHIIQIESMCIIFFNIIF